MYTQKKPIENTHIVRERDRRRFRELLAVLFLGVPIGLFLLLFTWQNLEVIRLGHEATRLQKQLKDVASGNKALQLELDRLTALDSVEQQAIALGFEATPAASIVMVSPSDGASRVAEGGLQSRDRTDDGDGVTAAELRSTLQSPTPIAVAAATPSDGRR
ncbi:MAG: hypothetical protein WA208_14005 [Thermoanaerobaculia bacterium]